MKKVTIRVTDELNDKLLDESKKLNISKNAYINILLTKRKVNIFDGKKEIFLKLNRIGNNLNQLTKLANSHITNVIDLKDVKSEIKNIWQFLNALK